MKILVVAYVVLALALGALAAVFLRVLNRRTGVSTALQSELDSTRRKLEEAESALATEEVERRAAADRAELDRQAAAERAAALQRLAETVAAAATPTAPAAPDGDLATRAAAQDRRVLDALWRLECLDLELDRHRDAWLSTADIDPVPVGLGPAVEQEITRIREEIGTPGTFESTLDREPDAAPALLLLRSVRTTLDFVARRCQAFDLHLSLRVHERRLAVAVVCDDFESDPLRGGDNAGADSGAGGSGAAGSDSAADGSGAGGSGAGGSGRGSNHVGSGGAGSGTAGAGVGVGSGRAGTVATSKSVAEAAAIAGAIAAAGGRLTFDRDADGRMRAQLSVPVT